MAYEFTELSTEERASMAKAQVRQFEQELFGHQLNQQRAESLPKGTAGRDQAIKEAQDAQVIITTAIEATRSAADDLTTQAEAEAPAEPAA